MFMLMHAGLSARLQPEYKRYPKHPELPELPSYDKILIDFDRSMISFSHRKDI